MAKGDCAPFGLGEEDGGGLFPTTQWTLVQSATGDDIRSRDRAVAELCRLYWYPIYAFIRGKGHSPEDAEDAVQGIFAKMLANDSFSAIRQEKGRLRSYLLTIAQNYLHQDWRRRSSQKRGGGVPDLSIDAVSAEERFALEAVSEESPDRQFQRRWAYSLLEEAYAQLEQRYVQQGSEPLFRALRPRLTGERGQTPYHEVAESLDMDVRAVKVAVHRMRKKFKQILLRIVAGTLADPAEAEAELRDLFHYIAGEE